MGRNNNEQNERRSFIGGLVDKMVGQLRELSAEELALLEWFVIQESAERNDPAKGRPFHLKNNLAVIYPVGDLHIGSASSDIRAIDQLQRRILDDDRAVVILTGDEIEGWVKKYTGNLTRSINLDKQITLFQRFLRPLYEQGKVVGMVSEYFGHPGWSADEAGLNIWKNMLGGMEVPLIANGATIRFHRNGKVVYSLKAFHQPPGRSKNDPVHGARQAIDIDCDGVVTSHYHDSGVENTGKELVAIGTPKGSNRKKPADSLGTRLGLPPTDPLEQGIILDSEKNFHYGFMNQQVADLVLEAIEKLDETESEGTTDERIQEAYHREGPIQVQIGGGSVRSKTEKDSPVEQQDKEKRTAKAISSYPEIGDSQSAYFANAYEVPYNKLNLDFSTLSGEAIRMPLTIEVFAHLRYGSSAAQIRAFKSNLKKISQDDHSFAAWMDVMEKTAGNLHDRRKILDSLLAMMGSMGDRNLALLLSDSLRGAGWKRAVGQGVDSLPIPPATYISQTAGVPLLAELGTIYLNLGPKSIVPMTMLHGLQGRGSNEKPLLGLQSTYQGIQKRVKPAVIVGGNKPGSGWGSAFDGDNPYTNYPIFGAPKWWSEKNMGENEGFALIIVPLGKGFTLVPVTEKQKEVIQKAIKVLRADKLSGSTTR